MWGDQRRKVMMSRIQDMMVNPGFCMTIVVEIIRHTEIGIMTFKMG